MKTNLLINSFIVLMIGLGFVGFATNQIDRINYEYVDYDFGWQSNSTTSIDELDYNTINSFIPSGTLPIISYANPWFYKISVIINSDKIDIVSNGKYATNVYAKKYIVNTTEIIAFFNIDTNDDILSIYKTSFMGMYFYSMEVGKYFKINNVVYDNTSSNFIGKQLQIKFTEQVQVINDKQFINLTNIIPVVMLLVLIVLIIYYIRNKEV